MDGLMKVNHDHNVWPNNVLAPAEVIKGKSIRLFGCDVYLSETDEGSSLKESSMNERDHISSNISANDEGVKAVKHGKYYKCQFCDRLYSSSQALGGHQNAHKSERVFRKRMQHEARKASVDVYLRSLRSSFMHKSAEADDAGSGRQDFELGVFNPMYHNYQSYKYDSLFVESCGLQVHVPY